VNAPFPAPDANAFGQRRLVEVDRLLLPFLLESVLTLSHPYLYTGDEEDVIQMVYEVRRFYGELVRGGRAKMLGQIIAAAVAVTPDDHLLCDGSLYEVADYPELAAVLAPTYLIGVDGFRVPDLRGRTVIGAGTGAGLTARAIDAGGGFEGVVLGVPQMPAHTHPAAFTTPAVPKGAVVNEGGAMSGSNFGLLGGGAGVRYQFAQQSSQGGGLAHENMQPFRALNYYIVAR